MRTACGRPCETVSLTSQPVVRGLLMSAATSWYQAGCGPAATYFLCLAKESKQRKATARRWPSASRLRRRKNGKRNQLASLKHVSFLIHFPAGANGSVQSGGRSKATVATAMPIHPPSFRRKVEQGMQTACGLPAKRFSLASENAPCKGEPSGVRHLLTPTATRDERQAGWPGRHQERTWIGKWSWSACGFTGRSPPAAGISTACRNVAARPGSVLSVCGGCLRCRPA